MLQVRLLAAGDEAALEKFLSAHWAQAMFLRSNLRKAGFANTGAMYHGTYAAAFDGDAVVAVATHYWNGNLVVLAPVALRDVVRAATSAGKPISGFIGPWTQALAAREALDMVSRPLMSPLSPEILFALEIAHMRIPTALADGSLHVRRATAADQALAAAWRVGFMLEAFGAPETPALHETCAADMAAWIAEGRLWLCERAGVPVCMTGFSAVLPDVVQVGNVFTPQAHRGKGYGRVAVAGSLEAAHRQGVTKAVLFTEEINVPARKIYGALGFNAVGDYGLIMYPV